ncbi:MAG: F0F1 ATP synthase subunit B [Planctomycetota bacterium]|nr:F0F1 ATP synthase subunit B [Planctomycetota bacterium]
MSLLLAAEGGNPVAVQLLPALTSIVVFVIFYLILRATVWPKIVGGLNDRADKIRGEIEAAEQARAEAKAAQDEYQRALAEARREAGEMIARAKDDAKSAAEELRKRNETELAEMKRRAGEDINAAKLAAIKELHMEAASLAATLAGKILQREISVEDQQRLVEESLRELGRVKEQ